jgi:zinc protease
MIHWALTLPSRHFARGIELLADAALAPAYPQPEVERERGNALSDLERMRDDMQQYPARLFLSAAFEKHPYGFTLETLESGTSGLAPEHLAAWHRENVLEGEPWVFAVGDVDPDVAAAFIAGRFTVAGGRPRAALPDPARWPAGGAVRAVQMPKAQTAMVLGFPGPSRMDADLYPLRVLSNAISGLGGRLFEELRSRHALAYAVSAYPIAHALGGAFVAYIATAPEREAEARERLLGELLALRDVPVDEEELARAKRYTIGAWQIRGQTNTAQLGDLSGALLLGGGLEDIRAFEQRIQAVTPNSIQAAVQRWFDPARVVEGVVRGSGNAR